MQAGILPLRWHCPRLLGQRLQTHVRVEDSYLLFKQRGLSTCIFLFKVSLEK